MTTTAIIGIGLAFVAMLSWGFGDFLIQKSTRKLGDWETLFLITLFGGIVLLPFVWTRIPGIFAEKGMPLAILFIASVVLFIAALLEFESLKEGKLAVIEPIWSFEVPVAAFLAYVLLGENISFTQIVIIVSLILCLILLGLRHKNISSSMFLEKGAMIAFISAIFMGGANFFMGWGGRISDPLMINFFSDVFIAVISGAVLLFRGRLMSSFTDVGKNLRLLLPMAVSDKVAWIAFVFSMTLAPIAIATAFSESYIVIAVLLGLVVNKEKLHVHQKFGLIGAIIMALMLALTISA